MKLHVEVRICSIALALASLKKYPLCLKSGKECGILRNFGTRLCVMLDRKLAEYRKEHPEVNSIESVIPQLDLQEVEAPPKKKRSKSSVDKEKPDISPKKHTASRGAKKYVPAWRSGPYALLITLLTCSEDPEYPGYMRREELQSRAQPLCDTSFKKPVTGSYYTAWSSMSLLVKKGLVSRSSNPAKYSLTPEGETLAKELQAVHNSDSADKEQTASTSHSVPSPPHTLPSKRKVNGAASSSTVNSGQKTSPQKRKQKVTSTDQEHMTKILQPGSFEVKLLVDTQESLGNTKAGFLSESVGHLKDHHIPFEVRHLKVGDFTWVCCDNSTGFSAVLPYIVERKRIDDFARSITDGRFHEQKFRLKQCGIQNLIYLVERHGKDPHTTLPLKTINQAAVNTQVIDGFSVKYTANHRESIAYLATLTRLFNSIFQNKTIVTCSKNDLPPFDVTQDLITLMTLDEFNKTSGKLKRFRVSDMFVRQLLQLHGLSVEKALAIVQQFPTPRSLVAMYQSGASEKLLADISHGSLGRLLGPVISKAVYQLYSSKTLS
ncbi:crossover junction endonuclease MUS81 isoform X2 [Anabrus simplex]|uniref:crossover junction endonuclease MUS81 isoform X2 n=1 Tax=Anabrus simplex TaxID=316456 RepID=UPI0035A2F87D